MQLDALRVARGTIFVSSARQSPRAEGANSQGGRREPGGAGLPRGRPPDRAMARTVDALARIVFVSVCFLCVRGGMTAAGMGVCVFMHFGFCCVVHARVRGHTIAAYRTVTVP